MPILRFLAYLQTVPENHGRNFGLEMMAADVIRQMPDDDQRPYMPWDELRRAVVLGESFGDDEPENLFTENIISANGNQIVFPGVYRNGSAIVNELLEVILTGDNSLPDAFKRLIYSAAGMLLFLSNQVAEDLGFDRYERGEMSDDFAFPAFEDFIEGSQTLEFDSEFLTKIAKLYGYQLETLDHFILDPKDPRLADDDPDNNVVSVKPLLKDGENYFLFMPTTVVSSLIAFIFDQAAHFDCHELLMKMLHGEQYHRAGRAIEYLGWQYTDIKLPENKTSFPFRESVWRFDNQKFGYLCYVPVDQIGQATPFDKAMQERAAEVDAYLKTLDPDVPHEVLAVVVFSETGHGEFIAMPKLTVPDRYLYLTSSELNAIVYDKESDFLTLWKFAGVFKDAVAHFKLPPTTGLLNLYAVYRSNHGALTNADSARPKGAMLMILPGNDVELKQEIKILRDEHAAELLVDNGVRAFTNVIRKAEFAPIYAFKGPLSREYRRLLDCFKIPVWVTNYQADPELLVKEIADALMFWLFRLVDDLAPAIDEQKFVQFEMELIVDEQILNGREFIVKTVEPDDIAITTTIAAPKLQLHIPYEFIYLTARPDNTGEKMLVKAALNGLVDYIREAGGKINLTPQEIEEAVEHVMQPAGAKMILFSDAAADVELDGHHLPPEHYFQDTDSSFVLDHLTSYLPGGYMIPEKIGKITEKIALCDALVTGLIGELSRRIAAFDGAALIKWLIKWNERCVFTREIREIRSPAKIACFEDFQNEVDEINKHDLMLVPTSLAIRTLIEFVAANPPSENKVPNYAEIDQLLAMANEVANWGSESEAMRMGLDDPEMGLLPSGRIGTSKKFQNESLAPYAHARNTGVVARFVERFKSRYVPNYKERAKSTAKSEEADAAFLAEFGVTITDISDVTGVLIDYGFRREEPCSALPAEELFTILKEQLPDKEENIIKKVVELMTLLRRESIGTFPKGYGTKDIFPWRFGRNLSYLRRPLVKLEGADGSSTYLFGFRHLKTYFENLIFLIFTGKLPESNSDEMSSFLGKINNEKGTPYRNEVKDWLKANTDLEVIDHEVKIEQGGHIPADSNYGDTDVMAVDHALKTVYSIECKNLVGARTIHEMKTELDLYLGREGKQTKAKIIKHVKRDEYLKANPDKLKAFLKLPSDDYEVVSVVVAAEEMPMAYIAREPVPLPIIAFHRLKLEGKTALSQK
ncbi:hypothetical protein [Mucilaginibacter sp. 3215]|uniref:hypothetical protein n=1 Tax=Mucilaginibacter sp. 3215 TaxID=3373912 RepID=UPI003D1E5FE5